MGNHPFFDSVPIERDMDVAMIARLAEVDERDLRALNPSVHQPVIMAAGTPQVLLPWDNAAVFQRNLQQHTGPLATWTAWRAPANMTPAEAAVRVGMNEAELRQVNRIPPRMVVRAGSTLLVHRNDKLNADVPVHLADNAQILLQPEQRLRRVTVKARKGDNLAALARRHGVSAVDAARWNQLAVNSALKVGQVLTLHVPERAAGKASARPAAKTAAKAPTRKPAAKKTTPRKKAK
jgi:membrane-bound lytic murein transglycosylase D